MQIREMFHDDINRSINGVIKVEQSGDEVTVMCYNKVVTGVANKI